jgi:hypothetical protein
MGIIVKEHHLTVEEIAEIMNLGRDKVTKMFLHEPGVLVLESPISKYKRCYRTLRIPESVFDRVYRRLQVPPA